MTPEPVTRGFGLFNASLGQVCMVIIYLIMGVFLLGVRFGLAMPDHNKVKGECHVHSQYIERSSGTALLSKLTLLTATPFMGSSCVMRQSEALIKTLWQGK